LLSSGLITLNPGSPKPIPGVKVVLAPGTGTGQGFLCPFGEQEIPFASEGGHVNFAPTNEIEDRLLEYLRTKIGGRVSMERILCGPGIINIYEFLKASGLADEPEPLRERLAIGDQAAIIAAAALSKEFPICSETIRIFARILGSHAGDLVLSYMATGGVYLAGGIPPKLAPLLESETVLSAYTDKGRFTDLVRSVPLYIIKDENAALTGACAIAISLLE
jgi:glucokinase